MVTIGLGLMSPILAQTHHRRKAAQFGVVALDLARAV
jgi:hypothetical protein